MAGGAPFHSFTDSGISGISSQAGTPGGNAGAIHLRADRVRLFDGSRITTETFETFG